MLCCRNEKKNLFESSGLSLTEWVFVVEFFCWIITEGQHKRQPMHKYFVSLTPHPALSIATSPIWESSTTTHTSHTHNKNKFTKKVSSHIIDQKKLANILHTGVLPLLLPQFGKAPGGIATCGRCSVNPGGGRANVWLPWKLRKVPHFQFQRRCPTICLQHKK